MSRPLRIEFAGAIYHVTSRGDRRESIFRDDEDRLTLLRVVGDAFAWADARMLAYCLMDNHYHFVLQTRRPNLSRLMRAINGPYTQHFNRRHALAGHLFQGRFHSVIVDRDAYLLAVCRYVELNPVRAHLVETPAEWRWSSYRAHVGSAPSPAWMDATTVLEMLAGTEIDTTDAFHRAASAYRAFVAASHGESIWATGLRQQIFLGDESFVRSTLAQAAVARLDDREIPQDQRTPVTAISDWIQRATSRDAALDLAYREGSLTMGQIASTTGLSVSRVSRIIAKTKQGQARPDPGKEAKGKT